VRVAALYDVHGMRVALEAVLADLGDVDGVVFGGDIFAGPQPQETYQLMRNVDALHLRGNAEREPSEWLSANLDLEAIEWGLSWPTTLELDGVLYCHATPDSDMPILTEGSSDERFAQALDGAEQRLVVAGHTHMQFRRDRWVNASSVGMPYEGDVAAFWALIGDDVEFRRTPFDVERAIAEIEATDWPGAPEFVAENLRVATSRKEAIEYFESIA
jgi:diadenosine tetraphosphatase ApaH/serine/threonine PP2A family protein phosphatase